MIANNHHIHESDRIMRTYKPPGIECDLSALINLTDVEPSPDIKFLLTCGHKFMLPFNVTKNNQLKALTLIETAIEAAMTDPLLQKA